MDNTTRFVRLTRIEIGGAVGSELVLLSLFYKLSPDDPEEYQARFALTIEEAEGISSNLSAVIRDITNTANN